MGRLSMPLDYNVDFKRLLLREITDSLLAIMHRPIQVQNSFHVMHDPLYTKNILYMVSKKN